MRLWVAFCLPLLSAVAGIDPGSHRLPSRFDEDTPGRRYIARASGYAIEVTPGRTSVALQAPGGRQAKIEMEYLGAQTKHPLAGEEPLAGRTNYFSGSEQSAWRTGLRQYQRVRQRDIYPGIDFVVYTAGQLLEYDLIVHPGADPANIRIATHGAQRVRLEPSGDMLLSSAAGDLRWKRPVVYQMDGERREPVEAAFVREGSGALRFRIGAYDRGRDLIIDPVLDYSTYLGAAGNETARAIAVDASGNVFIAGVTTSQALPQITRAVQPAYGGHTVALLCGDAFVAKFSPAGVLLFLTYLGGSADEFATSLAVDSAGNVWVAGATTSNNFPVSTGAYQRTLGGIGGNELHRTGDAFFARISASGDQLQYSSYFGGSRDDMATAIAIDPAGSVYLTGSTQSANFPLGPSPSQATYGGAGGEQVFPRYGVVPFHAGDVFVAKFNAAATQLVYSTYFGGMLDDMSTSMAVDATGAVYIGGYTLSTPPSFPVSAGAYQRVHRGADGNNNVFWNFGDGFIAKFSPSGARVYATLLGGSGDDVVSSIAIDAAGNVYATGSTCSFDFPITPGVIGPSYSGPRSAPVADVLIGDVFVAKLDPAGSRLLLGSYLGGTGDDIAHSIALDPLGNILLAGMTDSARFPVTATTAIQSQFGGGGQLNQNQNFGDAFLAMLDPLATKVQYATYLGGSSDDVATAMAIDRSGRAYLAGITVSRNFPVRGQPVQSVFGGVGGAGRFQGDAFYAKVSGLEASVGPALTAIQNGASYATGAVAPGMVFIAYGNTIGPDTLSTVGTDLTGKLATTASDTQLLFDGVPAPLVYVSAGQSSGIVPYEVAGKSSTQIVAVRNGVRSAPFSVNVAPTAPGLFSANQSGSGPGAIYNEDGKVNSLANPARRGSIVVLYGTGEGETDPPGVNGQIAATSYPKPRQGVSVTIGGQAAPEILYQGAVPGVVAGVFQINVRVPENIAAGAQLVVVKIGNNSSQANLTVAIQ